MNPEDMDPTSLAEASEALAMLGLAEGGGTLTIDQTLASRPDLEMRLAKLDPVIAAATFGGMLTRKHDPLSASKSTRSEA